MKKTEGIIGWVSVALIWLAFSLGLVAAWQGADALMKANSVVALLACLWLPRVMALEKYRVWRGTMQFAAFWLVFPLFKATRQFWIQRVFDAELLAMDRSFWGTSLPEFCMQMENKWLSEWASFGYIQFYFISLFPVIWFSVKRRSKEARLFFLGMSSIYCVGFIGYMLVPAGGPFIAFPDIFPYPPAGGAITGALVAMVEQGITGMDVFPSLHSAVSLYVLGFFIMAYMASRKRGYLIVSIALCLVCVPLVFATVYLRYHYGVDLIAGILLAAVVLYCVRKNLFTESRDES